MPPANYQFNPPLSELMITQHVMGAQLEAAATCGDRSLERRGSPAWPPSLPTLAEELWPDRLGGNGSVPPPAPGSRGRSTCLISGHGVATGCSGERQGAGSAEVAADADAATLERLPSRARSALQVAERPSPTPGERVPGKLVNAGALSRVNLGDQAGPTSVKCAPVGRR